MRNISALCNATENFVSRKSVALSLKKAESFWGLVSTLVFFSFATCVLRSHDCGLYNYVVVSARELLVYFDMFAHFEYLDKEHVK